MFSHSRENATQDMLHQILQQMLQLFFEMFQKSFKVVFYPFVANSFITLLAPKPLNSY